MLSERLKADIAHAIPQLRPEIIQHLRAMGPAWAVDYLLTSDPDEYRNTTRDSDVRELIENRDEAERFMAGCLGMM